MTRRRAGRSSCQSDQGHAESAHTTCADVTLPAASITGQSPDRWHAAARPYPRPPTAARRATMTGHGQPRSAIARSAPTGRSRTETVAAPTARWWDADADDYHAEHGEFLGDDRFVWCPEGLDEADAGLLGDRSRGAQRARGRLRRGASAPGGWPGRGRGWWASTCPPAMLAAGARSAAAPAAPRRPAGPGRRPRAAVRRRRLRPRVLGLTAPSRSSPTPGGSWPRWPGCCGPAAAGCSRSPTRCAGRSRTTPASTG